MSQKKTMMPVFRKAQLFFYHIPKTGGSMIEAQFGLRNRESLFEPNYDSIVHNGISYALQHMTPEIVQKYYPVFFNFESFAIMRCPIHRLISEYFWLQKDWKGKPLRSFRLQHFEMWLHNDFSLSNRDHLLPQYMWAEQCTHLFRISEIDVVINWLKDRTGIQPSKSLKHKKRNLLDTEQITRDLPTVLRSRIELKLSRDMELYDSILK